MSLVLSEFKLSDFRFAAGLSQNWLYCKHSGNKDVLFGLHVWFGLGIKVSSVVTVWFIIRFYDFVAVPASDHCRIA